MEQTILPAVIEPRAVSVVTEIVDLLGGISEFPIGEPKDYQDAADYLKAVKAKGKELEEVRGEVLQPLNAQLAYARDYFKPAIAALENAERVLKGAMLKFEREQEQKRQEEQRLAREKAEREAAEERKRIEAEAAQKRKEAEERRRQEQEAAQAATNRAEKERLEREARERQEAEERAILADAEKAKAAVEVKPVHVPEVVTKVSGIAKKVIWKHRVKDPDKLPRQYLMPNEKLLEQYARTQKEKAQVPGVEFFPEDVIAAGSK